MPATCTRNTAPTASGRPGSTGLSCAWKLRVSASRIGDNGVNRWPPVGAAAGAKYPVMSTMMLVATLAVTQIDPLAAAGTITELARTPPRRTLTFDTPGSAASQGNVRTQPSPTASVAVRFRATASLPSGAGLAPPSTTSRRTDPGCNRPLPRRVSARRRGSDGTKVDVADGVTKPLTSMINSAPAYEYAHSAPRSSGTTAWLAIASPVR